MTSIKKSVLIALEKYNHLLSQSHEPREKMSKEQQVSDPNILYQSDQEQSGGGAEDTSNSKWLFGIPSLFKRNVQAVIDHLRDHKDILSWNDRGEITYKGHVVLGSNLSDLLKDSQRHYKNLDPYGDREFYRAWAELNIPEGLLANEKRKIEVRYYKSHPSDEYIAPPPGVPRKKSIGKKKTKAIKNWMKL